MDPKRILLNIIVDLDRMPGAFHTPEDAERAIQAMLLSRIPHYNPVVILPDEHKA